MLQLGSTNHSAPGQPGCWLHVCFFVIFPRIDFKVGKEDVCLHFIFPISIIGHCYSNVSGSFFPYLKQLIRLWVLVCGFYFQGINIWISDGQNYTYYTFAVTSSHVCISLQTATIWFFLSLLTSEIKDLRWICLISKLTLKSHSCVALKTITEIIINSRVEETMAYILSKIFKAVCLFTLVQGTT